MRIEGWLLCSMLMACTHHAPPPAPADPTVGKLESPCPAPKSESTDAAEYERFVATAFCRIIEGDKETVTEQVRYAADGRELFRRWRTDNATGTRRNERQDEYCWRLDGKTLHESRIDGTHDNKSGHHFDETGKELEIDIFDMSVTYKECPPTK